MDKNTFKEELNKRVSAAEKAVKSHLPEAGAYNGKVTEAMESVMAGGKRLRPLFMMESFRLFSPLDPADAENIPKELAAFMSAMEYIHTYSLVHDDLPAMDNDELRRGRATTWKVYGDEAAARKRFAQYEKCTRIYQTRFCEGRSIERLTVSC